MIRLFVLGGPVTGVPAEVTVLAEAPRGNAIARHPWDAADTKALEERVGAARAFAEGGGARLGREDLLATGQLLHAWLLRGTVKALWDDMSGTLAGGQAERISVVLHFESPHLAGWPWELLADPGSGDWLATTSTPLSRALIVKLRPRRAPAAAPSKARALVMVGNTEDLMAADAETQWIQETLNAKGLDVQVERPKREDLGDLFTKHRPQIVHYVGHGQFDAGQKEGVLHLEDGPVPASLFAGALAPETRLVFLNGCETAKGAWDRPSPHSQIAAAILGAGVPAVVASQFSVEDSSAYKFAKRVYGYLLESLDLAASVARARQALALAGGPLDWATHVVYASEPEVAPIAVPRREALRGEAFGSGGVVLEGMPGTRAPPQFLGGGPAEAPVRRVGIADLDAKVAGLSPLLVRANGVQRRWQFGIVDALLPLGGVRLEGGATHLHAPSLAPVLAAAQKAESLGLIAGITRCRIMTDRDGERLLDYFSFFVDDSKTRWVFSTDGVREIAAGAGVDFAQAVFGRCLSRLLNVEFGLMFHDETAGCPLDFCNDKRDASVSLRRARFDHQPCRSRITDPTALQGIDALIALTAPAT